MREPVGDGDRVCHRKRLPERLGLAQRRQRLAIAQMRVHIHEADLAPEERRGFGTAEDFLRPAAIGDGPVHEPHAVGKEQMVADDGEMMRACSGVKSPAMMLRVIGSSE